MAKIVIVGAGIGGIPMALEMKENARKQDEVVVIADTPTFHFVPSNPWVAVNWRKPEDLKVELAPMFKKKKIGFIQKKVTRFYPFGDPCVYSDPAFIHISCYGFCVRFILFTAQFSFGQLFCKCA